MVVNIKKGNERSLAMSIKNSHDAYMLLGSEEKVRGKLPQTHLVKVKISNRLKQLDMQY